MIELSLEKKLFGSRGAMTLKMSATLKRGTFVVIMGESGAGKSTLLRTIAGLESAKGSLVVHGEVWQDETTLLPIQQREVGFLFQDYALFENMSVEENLLFVKENRPFAKELLEMMEIEGLATRNVTTLSGGQKQRVALARALMRRPKLLLLDEPFSSLDPRMRKKLTQKIKAIHTHFGTTTLMVSHDVSEAKALADEVWFVQEGEICPSGIEVL
jgi:molybdate transport system ATP-binding protein